MSGRILVIRGGAIGDFVLTLPALYLLRENFSRSHISLLGYKHIIALAEGRFYADEARSIEYASMAGFFNPKADLDEGLCEYFAGFNQVISYLFDPDGFFESNLRRAGVRNLLTGGGRLDDTRHAAMQLAAPLEPLAVFLENTSARIFPNAMDHEQADELLGSIANQLLIAVHPGSGSEKKNWPVERWVSFLRWVSANAPAARILLVSGESDAKRVDALMGALDSSTILRIKHAPLPVLGALFSKCAAFVGHDSGISHLAAASGCRSFLLFGPTDPDVWAPTNANATILKSPDGTMEGLTEEVVRSMFASIFAND